MSTKCPSHYHGVETMGVFDLEPTALSLGFLHFAGVSDGVADRTTVPFFSLESFLRREAHQAPRMILKALQALSLEL